ELPVHKKFHRRGFRSLQSDFPKLDLCRKNLFSESHEHGARSSPSPVRFARATDRVRFVHGTFLDSRLRRDPRWNCQASESRRRYQLEECRFHRAAEAFGQSLCGRTITELKA